MITLDFESRSSVNLLKAGVHCYAEHPHTQVLCLAYAFDEDEPALWHRGHPECGIRQSAFPEELADRIASGELVEAHNASFEEAMWELAFRREFPEFPSVRLEQWRCSAAKAAQFALPRSLDGLAEALGTEHQKDTEGGALMKYLAKAANVVDGQPVWNGTKEQFERNWVYCLQDVRTERSVSRRMRDLSPVELRAFQMDLRMNARGVTIDTDLVEAAIQLRDNAKRRLNGELEDFTGGVVQRASQRERLKKWVRENGFDLTDTQGDTVEEALKGDLPSPLVKRALEICRDVNRSSVAKYDQLSIQTCADGKARDLMLYFGASRTGRWSGKLWQPHNLTRGFSLDKQGVDRMALACEDLKSLDTDRIEIVWGSVMETLAKSCRGCVVADEGRSLYVADYSAIEARVLLWLAGDEPALQVFRDGGDIYLVMASQIYKREVVKAEFTERQLGKKAVLGLGYGMGAEKFDEECEKDDIYLERAFFKEVVRIYRQETFPLVPKLWGDVEAAAIQAVRLGEGGWVPCGKVGFGVRGAFLHCRLPSGHLLSYFRPRLHEMRTWVWEAKTQSGKDGTIRICVPARTARAEVLRKAQRFAKEAKKELRLDREPKTSLDTHLRYLGLGKGKTMTPEETYGGKLVENITQAVARDLLRDAMIRADDHGVYDLLLSVHDELIAEADDDKGNLHEFEEIMSELPAWAEGCPVAAEGWVGKRYRK